MTEPAVDEILKLSVEERLRLVDLIWQSLESDPSALPVSEAHLKVIEERLAEHRRNPNSTVSLDEVLAEARRAS